VAISGGLWRLLPGRGGSVKCTGSGASKFWLQNSQRLQWLRYDHSSREIHRQPPATAAKLAATRRHLWRTGGNLLVTVGLAKPCRRAPISGVTGRRRGFFMFKTGDLVGVVSARVPHDLVERVGRVLHERELASDLVREAVEFEVMRREAEIEAKRRAELLRSVENMIAPSSQPRPFGIG
jgi:hypothetical protein